ncbi:nucleotidyltransferase family protein [Rubellimicrobium aerolatum]|uniref:Nucleotidyltransferase family protein n=1 Tax=Rubellimicrobium aerolatum TaxID=490979 RepID=A0ABW0S979_9RHOB|nr:nucleotidyltransferase family protein [Rubellimicrobium aerolatum]MBP1804830.1 hypothetical protein [Rubellimicrobium aerolatum]
MASGDALADDLLAAGLRGPCCWPPEADPGRVVSRALFHGVAGLLAGRLSGWPPEATAALRRTALAQSMWEMRHGRVLADLLAALDAAGVRVLLLKGTALAYDLYDPPAQRPRGDSDLLVPPENLDAARAVLEAQGFAHYYDDPSAEDGTRLQEAWRRTTPDGLPHEIDLHWRTLNARALMHLFPFDAAWARARPLPRLAPQARGLPLDLALLLACAHRAQHLVNPYFANGRAYHEGDRLIWLRNIDLIARALDAEGWAAFEAATLEGGLAPVALEGLRSAAARLGTPLPEATTARLATAPRDTPAARYLLGAAQAGRALRDLRAVPGLGGKARYLWRRVLPPASFLRMKYPELAGRPVPLLHMKRIMDFPKPRRTRGAE